MSRLGTGLEQLTARQPAPTHDSRLTTPAGAPRAPEYVDETPKRPRRTEDEIAAERAIGAHWVTLLSIERPVPRHFGDNRGMLPLWIESNSEWRQSGLIFDRQQPSWRAIRLTVMGVPSDEHAMRLKQQLDEALHGRETAADADPLRHRFRNAVDFGGSDASALATLDVWWTPLLADAVMACELMARDFEIFTRAEHEAMVTKRAMAIAAARMRGR